MRPGKKASSVRKRSATISGAWFGSITPPAPTRMRCVAAAMRAMMTSGALEATHAPPQSNFSGLRQSCGSAVLLRLGLLLCLCLILTLLWPGLLTSGTLLLSLSLLLSTFLLRTGLSFGWLTLLRPVLLPLVRIPLLLRFRTPWLLTRPLRLFLLLWLTAALLRPFR